ncbi:MULTISPECIES: T9SS sorting signal type C domain-containing protein [unclassified Flavobacterium]|uniref:T9SS sorting signal type C domain-containing protein n=1 Tax=unclassified Flavobacterium TaxID=196869 RepID=UPI001F13F460|nr:MULTISPECIES: T9SS sorting signal type C domain-containing protein [unclassified Flavobacterium]UMY66873.1 T9SS sorting signal type C domain-containing protein [Flavobacterium sp. HJ-32-4]
MVSLRFRGLLLFLWLLASFSSFGQTYSTGVGSWTNVWAASSGAFTITDGIGLFSSGGITNGELRGRFIHTAGDLGPGTNTTLNPGQKLVITIAGATTGSRSGIVTDGIIGVSFRTTNNLFDGGSTLDQRYANNAVTRIEFRGGDNNARYNTANGFIYGNMPNFTTFKSGVTYELEVISDKEFNLVIGGTRNNIEPMANGGGAIRQIQLRNSGANMDGRFTGLSVANIPINVTANASETYTVTGVISNNGAIANTLQKNGVGTVILTGANTFTGLTTVNSGTLQLNRTGGGTLPSTADVTMTAGTLRISSNQTLNNVTIGSFGSLVVDAGVTLTVNGTLSFEEGFGTITVDGAIAYGASGSLRYANGCIVGEEWPTTNPPLNVSVDLTGFVTVTTPRTLRGDLTSAGFLVLEAPVTRQTVGGTLSVPGFLSVGPGADIPDSFTTYEFSTSEIALNGSQPIKTWGGSAYYILRLNGGTHHVVDDITASFLENYSSLVIDSGKDVRLFQLINMRPLTVANDANLIYASYSYYTSDDVTPVPPVTVLRNASMWRQDYVYWSSPVKEQNLKAFSPNTLDNRFYVLDEPTNAFKAVFTASGLNQPTATYDFVPGKGYMVRAPNDFANPGTLPQAPVFNGIFSGPPNYGTLNVPVTQSGPTKGYNLIGNPYSSTIDADATDGFLSVNPGTLYFWGHYSQAPGASNYAMYNALGGTAAYPGGPVPNGTIQTGQGFLFHNTSGLTQVQFTYAMQTGNNDGQFFRSFEGDRSRFWLNLSMGDTPANQIMVGYVPEGTMGEDPSLDGPLSVTGHAIGTLIGTERYGIQARPAFDVTDVVPMSLHAEAAGTFRISLDHVDGLFEEDQAIFLKDNLTGVVTNLKEASYSFATEAGDFNDRLQLQYVNTTLSTPDFTANTVYIYKNEDKILTVNVGLAEIGSIKVFDIRGRLVYTKDAIHSYVAQLDDLKAAQQVVLVQITSTDGEVVTKKVVY